MHEQEVTQSGNLPARLPQTTDLLRRTQGTLTVLRDVVQESSVGYWYERGKKALEQKEFDHAIYCYDAGIILCKYSMSINSLLSEVLMSRAASKLELGDIEGADYDEKESKKKIIIVII